MGRMKRINDIVKNHDSKLFCTRMGGKLCVMRENWKWEPYEVSGDVYYFMRPNHFFIFALTKDWRFNSEECEWGLLPIQHRLKEIDLWHRDLASEIITQEEKFTESKGRQRRSQTEDFLKEFRRPFAKAFNDVNVSTLAKKDKRQFKGA